MSTGYRYKFKYARIGSIIRDSSTPHWKPINHKDKCLKYKRGIFRKTMFEMIRRCVENNEVFHDLSNHKSYGMYVCAKTPQQSLRDLSSGNRTYMELDPVEVEFKTFQVFFRIDANNTSYPMYVGKKHHRNIIKNMKEGMGYFRSHPPLTQNLKSFAIVDLWEFAKEHYPLTIKADYLRIMKSGFGNIIKAKTHEIVKKVYITSARQSIDIIF